MTAVLPAQITRNQYIYTGISTFNYTFKIFNNSDLNVYITAPTALPDPTIDIISPNDYIVTGAGVTGGGIITITIPIVINSIVTIIRNVPTSLTSSFSDPQTFNGQNLDNQLERITALIQQNSTKLDFNTLEYPINAIINDSSFNNTPKLLNNYIWKGTPSGKVGTFLLNEGPDDTLLRSELANALPGTDGANIVGYNTTISGQKTVKFSLDSLANQINIYNATVAASQFNLILPIEGTHSIIDYTYGGKISFISDSNNSFGASTIDVNSIGAVSLSSSDAAPLSEFEINAGDIIEATVISPAAGFRISNYKLMPISVATLSSNVAILVGVTTIPFNTTGFNQRTMFNTTSNIFEPDFIANYEIECSLNIDVTAAMTITAKIALVDGTILNEAEYITIGAQKISILLKAIISLDGSKDAKNSLLCSTTSTMTGATIFNNASSYISCKTLRKMT